jgi:hypothetical protein
MSDVRASFVLVQAKLAHKNNPCQPECNCIYTVVISEKDFRPFLTKKTGQAE